MLAAASTPRNNEWQGGSISRNGGAPPNVTGNFTSVGAANTPGSQIGTPQIAFARQNRGSNIRIPYARESFVFKHTQCRASSLSLALLRDPLAGLVPLRGVNKEDVAWIKGRPAVHEYDGLEAGELAWILGRRLFHGGTESQPRYAAAGQAVGSNLGNNQDSISTFPGGQARSAHALGNGYGPDRMQRLASTDWVEHIFRIGINMPVKPPAGAGSVPLLQLGGPYAVPQDADGTVIDLAHLYLGGPSAGNAATPGDQEKLLADSTAHNEFNSDLTYYSKWVNHGNAINAPDVAWMCSRAFGNYEDKLSCNAVVGSEFDHTDFKMKHLSVLYACEQMRQENLGGAFLETIDAPARSLGYPTAAACAAAIAYTNPTIAYSTPSPQGQWGEGYITANPGQVQETHRSYGGMAGYQPQGIFVMERGPFLRGKPNGNEVCSIKVEPDIAGNHESRSLHVTRNLGTELAFSALEAELRRKRFFNWTPDGIVLSKFEGGPDKMSDAQMDARMAQMFNVAVQGQAISTTWIGDSKMECLPGDKVFVVVVADLIYHLESNDANFEIQGTNERRCARGVTRKMQQVKSEYDQGNKQRALQIYNKFGPYSLDANVHGGPRGGGWDENNEFDSRDQLLARSGQYNNYNLKIATQGYSNPSVADTTPEYRCRAYMAAMQNVAGSNSDPGAQSEFEKVRKEKEDLYNESKSRLNWDDRYEVLGFEHVAQQVRNNQRGVTQASLRNFRLKRVTSSYLQNNSFHDPSKPTSRCGLKISAHKEDGTKIDITAAKNAYLQAVTDYNAASTAADIARTLQDKAAAYDRLVATMTSGAEKYQAGVGEYIIGGWCIGTVLDSAASRAAISNQQVRSAPMSMAINVNVNVEWWSGDKLHRKYMDTDGTIAHRNEVYSKGGNVKKAADMEFGVISTTGYQPGMAAPDFTIPYGVYETPMILQSLANAGNARALSGGLYAIPTSTQERPHRFLTDAGVDPPKTDVEFTQARIRGTGIRPASLPNGVRNLPQPEEVMTDRFGRALPRPANRGPHDAVNYFKYNTAEGHTDYGFVPVTAF